MTMELSKEDHNLAKKVGGHEHPCWGWDVALALIGMLQTSFMLD